MRLDNYWFFLFQFPAWVCFLILISWYKCIPIDQAINYMTLIEAGVEMVPITVMVKELVIKSKNKRAFKNVSSNKYKELIDSFCNLHQVFQTESVEPYQKKFISVFDEWPASKKFVDSIQYEKEFYKRHQQFNFFLVENYNCFTVKLKGKKKQKLSIKEFYSTDSAKKYVLPSLYNVPSSCYFNLLIPEIKAIYFEGFDFVNTLLYQDLDLINQTLNQCEKHDLFALS